MDRTSIMRAALWATAFWNLGGVLAFTFPESVGQLMGLPLPAPRLYIWFIAFLILTFAVVYAWLAHQSDIDRPLVAVAAIGKAGFVGVVGLCWALDDVPFRAVMLATADLAFAAIFVWWLLHEPAVLHDTRWPSP